MISLEDIPEEGFSFQGNVKIIDANLKFLLKSVSTKSTVPPLRESS